MTRRDDAIELKRIVAEKRREGCLPRFTDTRAWAGNGSGEVCMLCEIPIDAGQIEYEVECQDGVDKQLLRFHELCYRLCSEP
jgi:hypothetical protein